MEVAIERDMDITTTVYVSSVLCIQWGIDQVTFGSTGTD